MSMNKKDDGPIILFDGVCAFCAGLVRFVIKRDRQRVFRFASLQSPAARQLLGPDFVAANHLESMILIENGRIHRKSTASIRAFRRLGWFWPLLYVLLIIPRPLRDTLYDWFGRHRYQWFGRFEECWVPDDDLAERFLDTAA